MILEVNWNPGAMVAMTILSIIVLACLTLLLIKSYLKERSNYKQELANFIEGVQNKSEIASSVGTYISRITKDTIFSMIYLDIDKYTNIVNAFGSVESKKLIEKISKKIIKVLPLQVQIGRIGTDQFVIFLRNDYSRNEAITLAKKIKEIVNEEISIFNDTIITPSVSVSVGFYPMDGDNFRKLVDSLKIAAYVSKRDGGNKLIICSNELSQKENENVNYYTQLKEAIKNNEFVLYYQPIIDLKDKSVICFEALLRWNHPEFGVLSPFKFIHILEQSGDINWVGTWGIETLIKEYLELKRLYAFKEISLSMNLSTRQLLNENLGVEFQKILKKYRMNASSLIIEIEEFIIFDQSTVIKDNITRLKELGFKIAVDSFAIDQSIISKIKDMPIDFIKIDCDFLKENQDVIKDRYVDLIVQFAKEHNISIIAEGIEDKRMYEQLEKYNIEIAEGYYFGKPMPDEEAHEYLSNEELLAKLLSPKEELPYFDPQDDDEPADFSTGEEVKEENKENN